MHIGITGPITLPMLSHLLENPQTLPRGYGFPNTASLALELHRRGHALSVIALDPDINVPSTHVGNNLAVHVVPMRARARERARDFFAYERHGLSKAIHEADCDVIHAHWTYEFALAAEAAAQLPVVVTAHDAPLSVARHNRHLYWWIRAAMAIPALHRSKHLTAVAPAVASQLRTMYGYLRPISVIPNGISEDIFFRSTSDCSSIEEPLFVSVAQGWGARKNVGAAVAALSLVRKKHRNARLILFGAGHGVGEEAHRHATKLQMTDGCEFRGAVSRAEVIDALAAGVTALVHPSRWEAHSVAVAEAMALGVPVIGGERSGGMSWTLAHGAAGLLVDVTDPAAIASAMTELVDDRDRRAVLAVAARRHARTYYWMPRVADQYESIYEAAVSES